MVYNQSVDLDQVDSVVHLGSGIPGSIPNSGKGFVICNILVGFESRRLLAESHPQSYLLNGARGCKWKFF